jgi:hypothetical protein
MAGPMGGLLAGAMQRFGQRPQGAPGGLAGTAQAAMGGAIGGPRGGQGSLGVPPGLLQMLQGGGSPQGQGGGLAAMLERIRAMPQFAPDRPQPTPAQASSLLGSAKPTAQAGPPAGVPVLRPQPQVAQEGPGMMGQGIGTMMPRPMPMPQLFPAGGPPGGGVGMQPGGSTITSSAPRPGAPMPTTTMRRLPPGMTVNGKRTY